MNENAWQQQNPRIKGSFGGSTKASVQGPKSVGRRNCGEVRSPQNETGLPWKEGAHASSGVRSCLTPSASQIHRGGKKSPPKADPVPLTPIRGGTEPAQRSGQRPGTSPLPGGHQILSWDAAAPHPLPWAPHTGEEGQQPQQRGPTKAHAPRSPPQGRQILSHPPYIRGWMGGGHTVPARAGLCVTGLFPDEGHPRASHTSEWGDRPPSAEGSPRRSHSSHGPAHTFTWPREGAVTQSHCPAGCVTGSPSDEGGRTLPSLSGFTPPHPRGTLRPPTPRWPLTDDLL